MNVSDSTTVTPIVVPPINVAARQPVRPAADGSQSARDRRDGNAQQDRGPSFRATLDATIVGEAFPDLAKSTTSARTNEAAVSVRAERRPSGPIELDAKESAALYRAAQDRVAARSTSESSDAVESDAAENDEGADVRPARQYFAASRQYAQRFFSVGGTYATRGDTLELHA